METLATGTDSAPLEALIIGAGFAGLGMGIALRKAGVEHFVIVDKGHDVGGVWRENRYPGAACDVPSHLYSFSFEPNPAWTHVFSRQAEIEAYLQHCARKYGLYPHLRFGAEVESARFDEDATLWRTRLRDGTVLVSRRLISAVGQLSRPALPQIEGLETFAGASFHSAQWDQQQVLDGQRVAVIGTGASAIQFVPAIAPRVAQLKLFQRSPAWLMARPDREYLAIEKMLLRRLPFVTRLYRLGHYLRYEARALAFTRLGWLMQPSIGWPFRRMLRREIGDPALRARLTPDYPIGCKRILISSDYLPALARTNVELVSAGIRRVTPDGIETEDGQRHVVDTIIYGTGFAATAFLTPMRICGRGGVDLNTAWQHGAEAYLGMTVPGFPNFFMLYGPNTNLGHNSIVYMIESQIAHLMRIWRAQQRSSAQQVEVRAPVYAAYNTRVQQHLRRTVWNGCKSWYVDAHGHNSTNWPGFTLSYRALTRFSGLQAYRFARDEPQLHAERVLPPPQRREAATAALLRGVLRAVFKTVLGPPLGPRVQRAWVNLLSRAMPGRRDVSIRPETLGGVPGACATPGEARADAVVLYLHGGAFVLGGPQTHRGPVSHLAAASGCVVHVPDYRLAPEHPYPAALDDALAAWQALRARGYAPLRIALAGDSAGAALAVDLALRLRDTGEVPAALALISPFCDPQFSGETLRTNAGRDPMIRLSWLQQGARAYRSPQPALFSRALRGLPPMLIQVGEDEILLDDALRLAAQARACGVACRLELHEARWHVFHLQTAWLASAVAAVQTLGLFVREQLDAGHAASAGPAANAAMRR